jgi:hypothetical protein
MAAAPYAVHLLGGVDEEEEQREGPRDGCSLLDGEAVDAFEQCSKPDCTCGSAPPITACRAETLDGLENRFAFEAADHTSERASEPAHIVV